MPGDTTTLPAIDEETLKRLIPPYRVVLYNDDHNSMDWVVLALVRSVPSLSFEQAMQIMFEAHEQGRATVIICPKETAEHYRERIETFKLTVTIEPA